MTLVLDTPTLADLDDVRVWRKTCPECLRTPRDLTDLEQQAFYRDVICNPKAAHRYYAVRDEEDTLQHEGRFVDNFFALVSLENISWENGHAEIGLIVDPARQRQGIGRQAVDLVLEVAFNRLRLATLWGEAYICNPQYGFWVYLVEHMYRGSWVTWPRRKFWDGRLHDAVLFTITREGWAKR